MAPKHRLLLSVCLFLAAWSCCRAPLAVEAGVIRQITAKPLGELLIEPSSSAPAEVVSLNESRVSAEIAAVVNSIPVRVGDHVDKGQTLATLECDDFRLRLSQARSALASAEARLELAASQLKRAEPLRRSETLSEDVLQQRQIDLKIARAERDKAESDARTAQLNVARCTVTAPFAGEVLARLASEGEWVATGTPLVTLLDSERLELSAQISIDKVKGLRSARRVEFVSEDERYPVKVRAMPAHIDPKLRQREVRLTFSSRAALPGQAGRLVWHSATPYLPANLLVRRDGEPGLFVVERGRAHFVTVPGALEGRPVPATTLSGDAVVVIDGRQSLRDGDAVKVVR